LDEAISQYSIQVNFFDVLYCDDDCMDKTYGERRDLLEDQVKQNDFAKLVPKSTVFRVQSEKDVERIETENKIEDFLENSINSGCEGLMLKALGAPYRAGTRGSNWLKLKREY